MWPAARKRALPLHTTWNHGKDGQECPEALVSSVEGCGVRLRAGDLIVELKETVSFACPVCP